MASPIDLQTSQSDSGQHGSTSFAFGAAGDVNFGNQGSAQGGMLMYVALGVAIIAVIYALRK